MLTELQTQKWNEVNSYLEKLLEQVNSDPVKRRKIRNIRAKLAWALDQYESGLASKYSLLQTLKPEVAEKFKEIIE